jgi:hypothetical protein
MSTTFEIHPVRIEAASQPADQLPWHDAAETERLASFKIALDHGLRWIRFDAERCEWHGVDNAAEATLGLKVVQRKLGNELAVLTRDPSRLINGLPALPVNVVGTKDSIVLAPGWLGYVTERVKPHVGVPLLAHLNLKCPFCRIPVDDKTRIVTCRCGAPYHHETAESHPETAENDRLKCFEKVKTCLSCSRPITLQEHLVWDPATL